jgi:hypothetical protein
MMASKSDAVPRRKSAAPNKSADSANILAEMAPMDGSHWSLKLHPFEYRRANNPALEDLTGSSGAQNPFFDPAFIAASRDRMTRLPLFQLVLWETLDNVEMPRFSVPLIEHQESVSSPGHFSLFTHEYAPIGNPLLSGADDEETLERFFQLLAVAFREGLPDLKMDYLTSSSPFFEKAGQLSDVNGIATVTIPSGNRAAVMSKPDETAGLSKKRRQELNRLQNRLAELGKLEFEIVTDPFDILLRLEEFLLIEAKGWKGRKGTSIHSLKRNAAFARQSVFDMAKEGKSAIYSLRLDGRAISSLIVFHSSGSYYPWKTAFIEAYKPYSPGKLLMFRFIQSITAVEGFRHLDSLAKVGSSWMSHLAPDEVQTATKIFSADKQSAEKLAAHFTRRQGIRAMVKRLMCRG